MALKFRSSIFMKLKPMLQQRFANAAFRPGFIAKLSAGGGTLALLYLIFGNQSVSSQSAANNQQLIRNQTHFSTTLAAHLFSKKRDSNIAFSPVSIHAVLSLLATGSKGQTQEQLLAFLKTNTTEDLNSLHSQTMSSILADGSINGGPRLSFANGIWVQKALSLKPSFKQVMDTVYKAACSHVDFTKAVEVANQVNLWVEKHTNGLIKDVIDANSVKEFTRLIIANAVYFKGAWSQNFDQSMTRESDFHLLHGNEVHVPFMTNNEDQFVHEYDNFKVLGLPYLQGQDKRQFTMYFFLPNTNDGLQSLVEKIGSTSDFLDRHIPHKKVEVGKFLIPKFKISCEFEATDMLKELGLVLPFINGGDGLTEMVDSSNERLYVSAIHHKSFVEVNEEGTEAAAVTHAVLVGSSLQVQTPKKIDFVADHPFLFVIREDVTGAVLFIGQVINPHNG